jgi:hypothetical protein
VPQLDLISARMAGLVLPACRIGSLARTTFLFDESSHERVTLDHLACHALDRPEHGPPRTRTAPDTDRPSMPITEAGYVKVRLSA